LNIPCIWGILLESLLEKWGDYLNLQFTIEVWKKGNWYLAKTPELDFISQGRTSEEAKKNLLEVVRIQFTE